MTNNCITNPFLNVLKDDINLTELYNKYTNIYIICNKTDIPIDTDIYHYYIDENKLTEITQKLILIKTHINILNKIKYSNKLVILSDIFLQSMNVFNYELKDNNVGLIIFNINFQNIQSYLSPSKDIDLDGVLKIITISSYLNNNLIVNKLDDLLTIKSSAYWSYNYRCTINMSKLFNKRNFIISNNVMKEIGCYLNNIHT